MWGCARACVLRNPVFTQGKGSAMLLFPRFTQRSQSFIFTDYSCSLIRFSVGGPLYSLSHSARKTIDSCKVPLQPAGDGTGTATTSCFNLNFWKHSHSNVCICSDNILGQFGVNKIVCPPKMKQCIINVNFNSYNYISQTNKQQ